MLTCSVIKDLSVLRVCFRALLCHLVQVVQGRFSLRNRSLKKGSAFDLISYFRSVLTHFFKIAKKDSKETFIRSRKFQETDVEDEVKGCERVQKLPQRAKCLLQ